uniref:Arrestin-like N-terminal domain-containing protein n=1 Tax=Mycena chlorophos TaxID=658473 RepID=A0ABQ0LYL4_MYCCL|nr:predicted protein [Mycena chlorophos]
MAPAPEALVLDLPAVTRVAGEIITGFIRVNMQLAQEAGIEQVRIKFRGSIHTSINGQSSTTYRDTVVLFHQKVPLWNQGSAYPEPGSHILNVPFQFKLPPHLPPSFHCEGPSRHATVGYSVEVIGERPGLFKFNKRIRRPFSVVPAASPEQMLLKESLRQNWNGPWKTWSRHEKLRRGIWGDYSHVRATILIPDIPNFPISTRIPFSLFIETDTKPMKREDCPDGPVDKHNTPLFPKPPGRSSEVRFQLYRWAQLRVRSRTRQVQNTYRIQKSIGDPTSVAAVVHTENPPQWIPLSEKDEKGKGFWRRGIKFESTVVLNFAPTWQGATLEWKYQLVFITPFAGIGNDFKVFIPIRLETGAPCPPPPMGIAGSSTSAGVGSYADVLPPGPPPMLDDLPPAYWAGDHHGWDGDEKN